MRYSTWNPGTERFDYWETPEVATVTNAGKPDHLKPRTLGATVEQACWPLPANARPIGSGPHAVGKVAIHPRNALGASEGGGLPIGGLLLAAAGALAVQHFLPRRRSRR